MKFFAPALPHFNICTSFPRLPLLSYLELITYNARALLFCTVLNTFSGRNAVEYIVGGIEVFKLTPKVLSN